MSALIFFSDPSKSMPVATQEEASGCVDVWIFPFGPIVNTLPSKGELSPTCPCSKRRALTWLMFFAKGYIVVDIWIWFE